MDVKILVSELISFFKVLLVILELRHVSIVVILSFKEFTLELVDLFELNSFSFYVKMLNLVLRQFLILSFLIAIRLRSLHVFSDFECILAIDHYSHVRLLRNILM